MIRTLLIANRGEIACRIIRTARRLGIRCIAVYSEPDRNAPHAELADLAIPIGPAPASESYLNIDRILEVAKAHKADAIHPGYGFLSENAEFARRCEAAGIHFVGPPAKAIEEMGSKSAAKALMTEAKVPVVPGYHGADQSLNTLRGEAKAIGYPVLIKASAGGGGKGMRVVWREADLESQVASAQRESQASFGDSRLLLEKYLRQPRHVEVQILFDRQGEGIYLFDRDCSVQRRHQKIIEEAPAPGIGAGVREAMGQAAVRCGQATGYVGAGTVEFLLDVDHDFYFMEMNTRLQVEHPVTEAITGLDLVEWQLRVAQGETLPWKQEDLTARGHAMEARLYAEDPARDFLPTSGNIDYLKLPEDLPGVRVDAGIRAGMTVGSDYDPMLAKVIARGETREEARRHLLDALAHTHLAGFSTNLPFLSRALKTQAFAEAKLATDFVDLHREELHRPTFDLEQQTLLSWVAWFADHQRSSASSDPWSAADTWRLAVSDSQRCEVRIAGHDYLLRYRPLGNHSAEVRGEAIHRLEWRQDHESIQVRIGEGWVNLGAYFDGANSWTVFAGGEIWQASINHPEFAEEAAEEHALTAPMHGRVIAVYCAAGDAVAAGQPLIVMEAMKMEHTIKAPSKGVISAVLCAEQDSVGADQPLVEFDANNTEASDG